MDVIDIIFKIWENTGPAYKAAFGIGFFAGLWTALVFIILLI